MTTARKTETQYAIEYLDSVMDKIGDGVITNPLFDDSDPHMPFIGFQVKKGTKVFNVWVLRDPEGNGSGHLEIEKG